MKLDRLILLLCLLVGSMSLFAQQKVNIYNADSIQKYLKERIADTKVRQKAARDAQKAVDKEMRTLQRDLEKSRAQAIKRVVSSISPNHTFPPNLRNRI